MMQNKAFVWSTLF